VPRKTQETKKNKKKNETNENQTILPPSFFFNFFVSFTSSDLLFSASAAASSFNYLKAIPTTTKSLLWSGQACIFFPLRLLGNIGGEEEEEERYTNMKNDLECVDIPPFPT
jgi:hypothetical protein